MTIFEAVRTFFENQGWKYADKEGWFESGVMLDGEVKNALIQVNTNEDALVILTASDFVVPESALGSVLEFVNILNMIFPVGCMYLDIQEHVVVSRAGFIYETDEADPKEVEERMFLSLDMTERAAKVLPALTAGELSPDEAAMQVLNMTEDAE